MGQSLSAGSNRNKLTHEQVSKLFAARCSRQFQPIEIWSFRVCFFFFVYSCNIKTRILVHLSLFVDLIF